MLELRFYFVFLFKVDFDGKITDTAIGKNKTHKKDHITVVDGEALDYVDHFIPTSGHGRSLATGVVNILAETDSLESLRVIGGGKFYFKVEKIKEDSLDSIPSPSVKIQYIGRKVYLR